MRPPSSDLEGVGAPTLNQSTIVRTAARTVLAHQGVVRVVDDAGSFVGVVDDEDILRVVVAEQDHE